MTRVWNNLSESFSSMHYNKYADKTTTMGPKGTSECKQNSYKAEVLTIYYTKFLSCCF